MPAITRAFARTVIAVVSKIAGKVRTMRTSTFPRKAFAISVSLAMVGPVLFQVASTAAQVLYPGHDFIEDAVSSLVFRPYGWLQTGAFYVFGVSLLALALTLFLKVKAKINAGAVMIALSGLGFIVLGMNQAQVPGATLTTSAIVHHDATIAVVAMSPLACFFLAPGLKSSGYSGLRFYSIAVGIFAVLFITIGGQLLVAQSSLIGIFERVLLWNGQLWAEIVCLQLIWSTLKKKTVPA